MKALAALLLLASAASAHADSDKVIRAARTPHPPVIDGRLDEAVWAAAPVDDRLTQLLPVEGGAPSQPTQLRILYDDDAIYFGARLADSQADQIVDRLTRRDRDIEADFFQVWIDSRDDQASAYSFRVYASNVQADAIYFESDDPTFDWDAVWTSAVTRDAGGWTVELRIPLSALRFSDADVQSWGFQAQRYISRDKEQDVWAFWPKALPGFCSRFGHIQGLAGLHPVRTFELRPFVVARLASDTDAGGAFFGLGDRAARHHPALDAGLDLKLGLTSGLTLDATVNPDFGQVEADQVVLNLSRFETFFPEKRPFFLEGADLFQAPRLFQTPIQILYSRRIGYAPSGLADHDSLVLNGNTLAVTEAPRALRILGAAKVTGKVSERVQVGALDAVTGAESVTAVDSAGVSADHRLAPPRNYALVRGRYDLGDGSFVAGTATAVDRLDGELHLASANHDAYTQSLDGLWVVDGDRFRLTGQAVVAERAGGSSFQDPFGATCAKAAPGTCAPITRADGAKLGPGAVGLGVDTAMEYTNNHLLARASYYGYSPTLDVNDMGYLAPWDQHEARVQVGWDQTKPDGPFRNWDADLIGYAHVAFDGTLEQLTAIADWEGTFEDYFYLYADLDWTARAGYDIFETFDGARYERAGSRGGTFTMRTDPRDAVVLSATLHAFDTSDGFDVGFSGELDLNPLPQLELALLPDVATTRARRFVSCTTPEGNPCTVDDAQRHYRFAQLDSAYTSFTLRGTYTFSPTLTLQAYAQLFLDIGKFTHYADVSVNDPAPRPIIRRADLTPSAGSTDDNFQDSTLNLNIVLRWEFRPGSTLIGVFTRDQNGAYDVPLISPHFRFNGLASGPTEDLLLLKFAYFFG